jgi:transcriptional regulator with XRE-family HTH domain
MLLGKKIKNIRLKKNQKVSEMAKFFGVSVMAVWRWETNRQIPKNKIKMIKWSNNKIKPEDFL